ncbi:MAG: hypothetical protein KKB50_03410 [Planctomycetes bacterium]|nr:hypothetical protein [Planctomycetota bacterium]
MRGATQCVRRLKQVLRSLRSSSGKVARPAVGDPVTQLILGIFSRNAPEPKAREALDRIRAMVVDYNELRVVPPVELAEALSDYPDNRLKAEDLSRALHSIFATEHVVLLDRLAGLPKKEIAAFLDHLDGLEAYTRARIRLLGLEQHAIPLDEAMWHYARQVQVVDERCPLEEAQAFLERQIAEEDALEFVALFRRQAWNEVGAAVRRGDVERILSIPPDRTSRHMLQAAARESAGGKPAEKPEGADAAAPRVEPAASGRADSTDDSTPPGKPKRPAKGGSKAARAAQGADKASSRRTGPAAKRRAKSKSPGKTASGESTTRSSGTTRRTARKAKSA